MFMRSSVPGGFWLRRGGEYRAAECDNKCAPHAPLSPLPLAGEGGERRRREPGEGSLEVKRPLPAASRRPSPAGGRGEESQLPLPPLRLRLDLLGVERVDVVDQIVCDEVSSGDLLL